MKPADVLADPKATIAAKLAALRTLQKSADAATTHVIARELLVAPEDLREPLLRALRKRDAAALYQRSLVDTRTDRAFAAKVLRCMKEKKAEAALAAALADDDADVRTAAAHALAVIGPSEATDALITTLADPSAEVRFFVVSALAAASDRERVKHALAARQPHETDVAVRSEIDRILRVN